MRRSTLYLLVITIFFFTLALRSISRLLSLLIEDAATDVVHSSELQALNSTQSQLIPKIIHQTYINSSIPERWRLAQQSCIEMHPDYEYKFWTDESGRAFIEREYPWFYEAFVGYPYNIQRADAIRYFALAHYGGVYLDLDNGCRRRLDPLLRFPAWVHLTKPTGISNDGMGATPRHPFFLFVIDQLQHYNKNWILPYITIMSTTGPLFLSIVWKSYMQLHLEEEVNWNGRVRVLTPEDYFQLNTSFFNLYGGNSWHSGDARFILWMGKHWLSTILAGSSILAGVGFCVWWAYGRLFQLHKPVTHDSVEGPSPRVLPHRSLRFPQWRAWNWRNVTHRSFWAHVSPSLEHGLGTEICHGYEILKNLRCYLKTKRRHALCQPHKQPSHLGHVQCLFNGEGVRHLEVTAHT